MRYAGGHNVDKLTCFPFVASYARLAIEVDPLPTVHTIDQNCLILESQTEVYMVGFTKIFRRSSQTFYF